MKRDTDIMVEIVEALASGERSLSGAALRSGVAVRTFWTWLKFSRENDERFLINWPDPEGEPVQFYRAVSMARKLHALEVRSKFEKECLTGWSSEVHFQGQVVWRQHPGAFNKEKRELLILLGECDEDGYMIDERGHRLPVMEHHHPPAAMVNKFIESFFPEYRTHTVSDTNLNIAGGLTLGVTSIPHRTRADGPPEIPPPPQPPRVVVVEKTIAPAPLIEEASDEPADDVTSTEPVTDDQEAIGAPVSAPEPRVIREPASESRFTPTATERSGRPLSALEAELLGRLRGDPAKRSAAPIGSTKSTMPTSTRADFERR